MDSLLFNFLHKSYEFCLNSSAKIISGIIFSEHIIIFIMITTLKWLVLQRMLKWLPILLFRSLTIFCTVASKSKTMLVLLLFFSDSFMAVESVAIVLSAVPFSLNVFVNEMFLAVLMKKKAHRTKLDPSKMWLDAGKLIHLCFILAALAQFSKGPFLGSLSKQKNGKKYNNKWLFEFFRYGQGLPHNAGFQLRFPKKKGEHKHPMTCTLHKEFALVLTALENIKDPNSSKGGILKK